MFNAIGWRVGSFSLTVLGSAFRLLKSTKSALITCHSTLTPFSHIVENNPKPLNYVPFHTDPIFLLSPFMI